MHKDKYVFAQLVEFIDRIHFNYLVRKYLGDRYIKSFTCWNQLLVMMFGQLSKSESLRDFIIALEAHWRKLYHLGMDKSVTRSNLAKANEQRDYRIFEDFAYHSSVIISKNYSYISCQNHNVYRWYLNPLTNKQTDNKEQENSLLDLSFVFSLIDPYFYCKKSLFSQKY